MDIKEARRLYKEANGKNPSGTWDVEMILSRVPESMKNPIGADVVPEFAPVEPEIEEKEILIPSDPSDIRNWEELTEEQRVAAAKIINETRIETVDEFEELTPVFRDGEPFCIINNEYIPWKEAVIVRQKEIIRREQEKLNFLLK